MTYKTFDIVVVPFPFVDRAKSKNRPALILSGFNEFNAKSGHSVLAMITSAKHNPWPLDVSISDLAGAGLSKPSLIRMKLFTLDNRLIKAKIGELIDTDKKEVSHSISQLLLALFDI